MLPRTERYHILAIALHWVMAIAFILMLTSGLLMTGLEDKQLQFQIYQWHKSLGVLLLLAFFLRLALRLFAQKPELPAHLPAQERTLAHLGHWALYGCMIAMPITGWIMVSSSIYGLPTIVFGWFEWPHLPGIAADHDTEELAELAHEWIAYGFIALILGHILAVIKHAYTDNLNLLPRMGIGRVKDTNR